MPRIIFKALVWGVVSWVLLNVLIFFGTGVYTGFIARDPNAYVSPTLISALRYASLFVALGIAAYIFLAEEKKHKPVKPFVDQLPPKPPAPPPAPPSPPQPPEPVFKPETPPTPPPTRDIHSAWPPS